MRLLAAGTMLAQRRPMIHGNDTFATAVLRRAGWFTAAAIALCAVAACSVGRAPEPGGATATSLRVVPGREMFVVPNPHNSLSSVVTFDARGFDSARVVYWAAGEPPRVTPFSRARGVGRIVTLGLRPETPYFHILERIRGEEVVVSDTVQSRSGQLPDFLRRTHMRMTGRPTSGYVLTSMADSGRTGFVVAFDSTGQLSWYREFPGEMPAGETKQQPNGDFTVFLGRTPGWMFFPGSYEQFRPVEKWSARSWRRRHSTRTTTSLCSRSAIPCSTPRTSSPSTAGAAISRHGAARGTR